MGTSISLARSADHYDGVRRTLAPFAQHIAQDLSGVPSLVVKVNLVISRTPRYSQGVELATTPLDAVRAFIDTILPVYSGRIVIAEEPAWGTAQDGFELYGFSTLAGEYPQVELLDLRADQTRTVRLTHPQGELDLPLSVTLLDAPFLVSIARPKTHCNVVMTATVKNVLVGAIQRYSNRRKIHRKRCIHYILASLAGHVYPDLAILDGTVGMQGGGPVRGTAIEAGWALASFDALAADSMAAHLMEFDIRDIGYLNLLAQRGLGSLYPSPEIEVLGGTPASLVTPFEPHRSFKQVREWELDG
jgi:uncharacterized protein (DUF362 family)